VDGVGCIWVSDDRASYIHAGINCSKKGSELFSPSTIGGFENLRQYLIKGKFQIHGIYVDEQYYVRLISCS